MKIRNTLSCLIFLLPAFPPFRAESVAASTAPVPALSLSWAPPAGSGDTLVLTARVLLPKGWYINSNTPLDSFLVATRAEASAPGLKFGPPRYPAPVVEYSQAMAGNMSLFKGDFVVGFPAFKAEAKAQAARGSAAGKQEKQPISRVPFPAKVVLHYQSCDGTTCWPPKSVTAVLEDGKTRLE